MTILLLAVGIYWSYRLYKHFGFAKGWMAGALTLWGLLAGYLLLAFIMQACF